MAAFIATPNATTLAGALDRLMHNPHLGVVHRAALQPVRDQAVGAMTNLGIILNEYKQLLSNIYPHFTSLKTQLDGGGPNYATYVQPPHILAINFPGRSMDQYRVWGFG